MKGRPAVGKEEKWQEIRATNEMHSPQVVGISVTANRKWLRIADDVNALTFADWPTHYAWVLD